ncbi:MAG: aspartate--tRNA(Asn) ligase [Bacillota bacterium]|nr:aspartate--tRNA(Asn) ligase [Bacillota bacterium]
MKRVMISDLKTKKEMDRVLLNGWIHRINNFKNFSFVTLRDRSGLLQMIVEDEKILEKLKLEISVEVVGTLIFNDKSPKGREVHVDDLEILGEGEYNLLPFSINGREIDASLEKQLDYRTITLRRRDKRSVFKIQQGIVEGFREFLTKEGFYEIHTPKIIGSETEGGSEVFTVDYFGQRAFLAQSPQFYKQMMVGSGMERVFEIGAAYRAELHSTWRHLNEYMSLDLEMGFISDEHDIMDLEEKMMKYIVHKLESEYKEELDILKVELPKIDKIPRIPLEEAQDILLEKYGKKSTDGNIDGEGEKLIYEYVKEKYDSEFVFLTDYPKSKRPLYTMPKKENPEKTNSFDLIFRGLEITTGGQRINSYSQLKRRIVQEGIKPEVMDFYLETFKYGMPPHGGLAIGLERLTMMLLKLENIREATLFPRDINRIKP